MKGPGVYQARKGLLNGVFQFAKVNLERMGGNLSPLGAGVILLK